MHFRVELLDRKDARNKGLIVIEPGPPEKIICLHNEEHALVELRNLASLEEDYWYAVVVTARPTGMRKIVLKARCYKDARGHYFAFASNMIVMEAINCGKKWALNHLKNVYGIDPVLEPGRFKRSVESGDQFVE